MIRSENNEENKHFETVLNRLDALLRRDYVAGGMSDIPSRDTISPMKEDDEIPVLTEVYEGEAFFLKAGEREVELPLLGEFAIPPEKHASEGDALQPDAYFGRLAALRAEDLTQPHRLDEVVVDYDALVGEALVDLVPQIQEAMARTIEEEMVRAQTQLQLRVIERMRDEIESVLRQRLQELLVKLVLNRNEARGS